MSEQETVCGKLKLLNKLSDETLEQQCKRIYSERFTPREVPYWDSFEEDLMDDGYKKFTIYDDNLYEVISKENFDSYNIFDIKKTEDGTFDFVLSYYNGGCSFDEAIEHAFNKMKERDRV